MAQEHGSVTSQPSLRTEIAAVNFVVFVIPVVKFGLFEKTIIFLNQANFLRPYILTRKTSFLVKSTCFTKVPY